MFISRLPFLLTTSAICCTINVGVLNVSFSMYPQDLLLTEVSVCHTFGKIVDVCPRSISSTAESFCMSTSL